MLTNALCFHFLMADIWVNAPSAETMRGNSSGSVFVQADNKCGPGNNDSYDNDTLVVKPAAQPHAVLPPRLYRPWLRRSLCKRAQTCNVEP